MNKVILIGRLGKDAEAKQVGDTHVITFSVATSEKFKTKTGEVQEKTEWHNVNYWSRSIKILPFLQKGTQVMVEGSISTDKVDNNGDIKYYTKIKAQKLELLSSEKQNNTQTAPPPTGDEDDLPF